MTELCRNRWILLGAVWVGVALLLVWNLQTIDSLAAARNSWQLGSSKQRFIDGLQQDIVDFDRRVQRLSLPVESPAFGLMYADEDLTRLAARYGLQKVKVELESSGSRRGELPLKVSCDGTLSGVIRWMTAVREDLPWLAVSKLDVRRSQPGMPTSFSIQMNLRYKLVSS